MKHPKRFAILIVLVLQSFLLAAQTQQPSILQSGSIFNDEQNALPTNTLGPFQLLTPLSNIILYTEPGSLNAVTFRWTTSAHATNYTWSYLNATFTGNPQINAPTIPLQAPDTALTITMGYLDHIMDSLGAVMPGDSVLLIWGAFAKMAISDPGGRWPDSLRTCWLVRSAQIQAFDLESPANQTRVLLGGTPSNPMQFSWQRAVSPAPRGVQYVLQLDTSPNFTNALFVGTADSLGLAPQLRFTVGQFDSLLAAAGVNLGDSIQLYWKVVAQLSRTSVTSTSTYSAWFVRTGLTSSTAPLAESQFSMYPNPAKDFVLINGRGAVMDEVRVFNLNGAEVLQLQPQSDLAKLQVHDLAAGTYLVRVQTKMGVRNLRLVVTR